MQLILLWRIELVKIYWQRGTYLAYAVLAVVTALTTWGLKRLAATPQFWLRRMGGEEMAIGGKLVSAYSVARHLMEPAFVILIPMLVAMICGGLIAGEQRSGVLRTWLCRPISRLSLYTAKCLAGAVYALSLALFLGLFSLFSGYIVFGGGDLITWNAEGLVILEEGLAWPRLAFAYGLAGILMCCFASMALLASLLFDNPLVAAGATMAVIPLSSIVQHLESLAFLQPYLLTTYLDSWQQAFAAHLDFAVFIPVLYCAAGYCVVPYIIGLALFRWRDVTA